MTHNTKMLLIKGVSLAALLAPALALAQAASPAANSVEEVVVTGSRLQSTGFQAPTPVTATTADDLKQASPKNLADALVQLPTFNGNTRSDNPQTAATNGTNGQNLLNLRGLGPNRTLVLLDGRRLPATNSSGSVDVNIMPQNLVRRVDVVTGGASAAYGSDAVSGVVNFVLDTKFEGWKGELQGGISKYNDLGSKQGSIAYGHSLLDGRARFIASAEAFTQKGVGPNTLTGRNWFDVPAGQIPNPVVGATPSVLVISDIRNTLGTYGGLITNTVLKGQMFLPGGATATFNPGTVTGTTFQSGGDGAKINIGFAPDQTRATSFLHGEFDVSDKVTLFAEAHYAYSHVTAQDFVNPHTGTANQFTIFSGNAYLPAAIQQRMTAGNIASFTMGRYERDMPPVEIETITDMERLVFGAKGDIAGSWKFDGAVTYGETHQKLAENNLSISRRLYAAADAVVNPANGQIVCRSTLAGLDPGCVPLNLFGEGAVSAAAVKYVTGSSIKYLELHQTVAAFNIHGDLGENLQLGAGPIAVAMGVEYRKESADQTVDALSPLTTDFTGVRGGPTSQQGKPGSFNFFNPLPLAGKFDIKEGYLEVGVPVLKDKPFAKSLDIDGAVRHAVYSQSGGVNTWKVGVNYQVVDDLRLRLTRSQDIRGPNILELFNSATQNSNNQIYKGVTTQTLTISSGNPNLRPERAETLTYGVVYRPNWVPGLQVSLDYYKINIHDAIGSLTAQRTIDECAAGNQLLCAQITVTPANTLIVRTSGLNLNVNQTAGYDLEAAYSAPLAGGRLGLRALVNHATTDYTQAPGSPITQNLDQASSPKWRGSFQARYTQDALSVFLQERFIWKGKFDPTKVQGVFTNDNEVPTIAYTDVSASYKLNAMSGNQELFVSINNLLNQKPPVDTNNPTSFSSPTNVAYDRVGRYYTAGVRFQF